MLHQELFGAKVKEEWLDPSLVAAMRLNSEAAWRGILTEEVAGVPLGPRMGGQMVEVFLPAGHRGVL